MTTAPAKPPAKAFIDCDLPGVRLGNQALRVRVTDNAPRYNHVVDCVMSGMNGVALLFDKKHHKNIFSTAGLSYAGASTRPASGAGVAPTLAPMTIAKAEDGRAVLTQVGADATGLDARIEYALGERHIDQTITVSSERGIEFFDTFWTSHLNGAQCTSLFLQGVLHGQAAPQWLEVTTPGMGNGGRVYYRPFDPRGKSWSDHVVDNPVLRQKAAADAESIAATLKAGFVTNEPNKCAFTGFYYGLFDDHLYLMIFREPEFYFWTGTSGATIRNPSWDYGLAGGPLKAGERKSFHARLVFKPFAGVDDVMAEVRAFRGERASELCGLTAPR